MVKKILLSLCNHLNLETNRELADYLGIKVTQIYSWRKHGKITDTGKILAKLPYIHLDWLETGEGPMMIIDKDNIDLLPNYYSKDKNGSINQKTSSRIETGNGTQWKRIEKQREREKTQEATQIDEQGETNTADHWSMSEMLVKTTAVLESKTVYRSALASNVRAFYEAVKKEEEMSSVKEQLQEIQEENRTISERMARMEEMLLSMGAAVPQKREQKTG